ncbi:MAG: hypothetical protein SNH63_07635 [Rikenellaceae bacterium]
MKNFRVKIFMVAVAVMSVVSAEAKIFSFGPSAALNTTNFSIKGDAAAIANHVGYQAGVDLGIKLPLIGVTAGLYYTSNTFTACNEYTSYETSAVKARSLNVPVLFGLSLFGPLTIEAGPVFTIKEYNKQEVTLENGSQSVDLGSLRKKDTYLIGVRATLFGVTAYARYNQQFGTQATEFGDMKYSGYTIGLGFRF